MWFFKKRSDNRSPVSSATGAESVSGSYSREPITNPGLKAAIATFFGTPNPATQKQFWAQLGRAKYLMIVRGEGLSLGQMPPAEQSQPVAGGTITSQQVQIPAEAAGDYGNVTILTARNGSGETFLPVFTDWDEVIAFHQADTVTTLVFSARDLCEMALGKAEPVKVVINPAGQPVPLTREQLQELQKIA